MISHNVFAYCSNNPVNRFDPDGRAWWVIGAIAGAVVGGIAGAAYSYYTTGSVDWRYVAGGAAAGALIGAGMGYAAEAAYTAVVSAIGTKVLSQGYDSFNQLKNKIGPAGKGYAWHHIVEQTPANVQKLGTKIIQNVSNVVKLEHGKGTIHAKISGYYSSIQPFTNGQTVRQWLSPKSFKEQYEFGMKVIKLFGGNK